MNSPSCLILRTAGTNCDRETAYAFGLAGARTTCVHVKRLLADPSILTGHQLLAIPGGFSYGDDLAAGRVFAHYLRTRLADPLRAFVDAGKPIIGICNGFQVLVQTDLLPGRLDEDERGDDPGIPDKRLCSLTDNARGRFLDRWVTLKPHAGSRCVWTRESGQPLDLPVAHGEGRLVCRDDAVRRALWDAGRVVLTYADAENDPNGSTDAIAGLCDASGLVFGLMPHPERYVEWRQHPAGSGRACDASPDGDPPGLKMLRAAVGYVRDGGL